jgi:hypothetical protein
MVIEIKDPWGFTHRVWVAIGRSYTPSDTAELWLSGFANVAHGLQDYGQRRQAAVALANLISASQTGEAEGYKWWPTPCETI